MYENVRLVVTFIKYSHDHVAGSNTSLTAHA